MAGLFGLLGAAIFGGAAIHDSVSKSCRDADARARYTAEEKPYYPTSDNYYIYIPTGEKCKLESVGINGYSYANVLVPYNDRSLYGRIVYVLPMTKSHHEAMIKERNKMVEQEEFSRKVTGTSSFGFDEQLAYIDKAIRMANIKEPEEFKPIPRL